VLLSIFILSSSSSYLLSNRHDLQGSVSESLNFSTDTWGFFDVYTGEVLLNQNAEAVLPIASITKLFTAYAAVASPELNSEVRITWSDLNTEGKAGKLRYGEVLTLQELLFPLLVESSNDAGAAIARTLGAEYSVSVLELIKRLGIEDTTIVDSSGLHSGNVSSVKDLAQLYRHLKREFPHIIDITRLSVYIGESTGWASSNPAVSFDGYSGGKQGYIPEAGNTYVGSFETESGKDIGIIFLGSINLESDIEKSYLYIKDTY